MAKKQPRKQEREDDAPQSFNAEDTLLYGAAQRENIDRAGVPEPVEGANTEPIELSDIEEIEELEEILELDEEHYTLVTPSISEMLQERQEEEKRRQALIAKISSYYRFNETRSVILAANTDPATLSEEGRKKQIAIQSMWREQVKKPMPETIADLVRLCEYDETELTRVRLAIFDHMTEMDKDVNRIVATRLEIELPRVLNRHLTLPEDPELNRQIEQFAQALEDTTPKNYKSWLMQIKKARQRTAISILREAKSKFERNKQDAVLEENFMNAYDKAKKLDLEDSHEFRMATLVVEKISDEKMLDSFRRLLWQNFEEPDNEKVQKAYGTHLKRMEKRNLTKTLAARKIFDEVRLAHFNRLRRQRLPHLLQEYRQALHGVRAYNPLSLDGKQYMAYKRRLEQELLNLRLLNHPQIEALKAEDASIRKEELEILRKKNEERRTKLAQIMRERELQRETQSAEVESRVKERREKFESDLALISENWDETVKTRFAMIEADNREREEKLAREQEALEARLRDLAEARKAAIEAAQEEKKKRRAAVKAAKAKTEQKKEKNKEKMKQYAENLERTKENFRSIHRQRVAEEKMKKEQGKQGKIVEQIARQEAWEQAQEDFLETVIAYQDELKERTAKVRTERAKLIEERKIQAETRMKKRDDTSFMAQLDYTEIQLEAEERAIKAEELRKEEGMLRADMALDAELDRAENELNVEEAEIAAIKKAEEEAIREKEKQERLDRERMHEQERALKEYESVYEMLLEEPEGKVLELAEALRRKLDVDVASLGLTNDPRFKALQKNYHERVFLRQKEDLRKLIEANKARMERDKRKGRLERAEKRASYRTEMEEKKQEIAERAKRNKLEAQRAAFAHESRKADMRKKSEGVPEAAELEADLAMDALLEKQEREIAMEDAREAFLNDLEERKKEIRADRDSRHEAIETADIGLESLVAAYETKPKAEIDESVFPRFSVHESGQLEPIDMEDLQLQIDLEEEPTDFPDADLEWLQRILVRFETKLGHDSKEITESDWKYFDELKVRVMKKHPDVKILHEQLELIELLRSAVNRLGVSVLGHHFTLLDSDQEGKSELKDFVNTVYNPSAKALNEEEINRFERQVLQFKSVPLRTFLYIVVNYLRAKKTSFDDKLPAGNSELIDQMEEKLNIFSTHVDEKPLNLVLWYATHGRFNQEKNRILKNSINEEVLLDAPTSSDSSIQDAANLEASIQDMIQREEELPPLPDEPEPEPEPAEAASPSIEGMLDRLLNGDLHIDEYRKLAYGSWGEKRSMSKKHPNLSESFAKELVDAYDAAKAAEAAAQAEAETPTVDIEGMVDKLVSGELDIEEYQKYATGSWGEKQVGKKKHKGWQTEDFKTLISAFEEAMKEPEVDVKKVQSQLDAQKAHLETLSPEERAEELDVFVEAAADESIYEHFVDWHEGEITMLLEGMAEAVDQLNEIDRQREEAERLAREEQERLEREEAERAVREAEQAALEQEEREIEAETAALESDIEFDNQIEEEEALLDQEEKELAELRAQEEAERRTQEEAEKIEQEDREIEAETSRLEEEIELDRELSAQEAQLDLEDSEIEAETAALESDIEFDNQIEALDEEERQREIKARKTKLVRKIRNTILDEKELKEMKTSLESLAEIMDFEPGFKDEIDKLLEVAATKRRHMEYFESRDSRGAKYAKIKEIETCKDVVGGKVDADADTQTIIDQHYKNLKVMDYESLLRSMRTSLNAEKAAEKVAKREAKKAKEAAEKAAEEAKEAERRERARLKKDYRKHLDRFLFQAEESKRTEVKKKLSTMFEIMEINPDNYQEDNEIINDLKLDTKKILYSEIANALTGKLGKLPESDKSPDIVQLAMRIEKLGEIRGSEAAEQAAERIVNILLGDALSDREKKRLERIFRNYNALTRLKQQPTAKQAPKKQAKKKAARKAAPAKPKAAPSPAPAPVETTNEPYGKLREIADVDDELSDRLSEVLEALDFESPKGEDELFNLQKLTLRRTLDKIENSGDSDLKKLQKLRKALISKKKTNTANGLMARYEHLKQTAA